MMFLTSQTVNEWEQICRWTKKDNIEEGSQSPLTAFPPIAPQVARAASSSGGALGDDASISPNHLNQPNLSAIDSYVIKPFV